MSGPPPANAPLLPSPSSTSSAEQPPPAVPSALMSSSVPPSSSSSIPAPARATKSPPLAHSLSTLKVADPPIANPVIPTSIPTGITSSLADADEHPLPSSKRRRSSAGGAVPASAPGSAGKGHRRTPSGRVLEDDDSPGSPLLGSSLSGFAGSGAGGTRAISAGLAMSTPGSVGAGAASGPLNGSSAEQELLQGKEKEEPPRISPLQTGNSLRASPAVHFELPSFPVLPPSQPAPNQTFQTPSQVSSILSLPPPLLLQLARTDSPEEQREIAERASAKSYLSSMAIPPPSPTTFVNDIQKAGLSMTPAASGGPISSSATSAPTVSSAAGASSTPSTDASSSALSLPSRSSPHPLTLLASVPFTLPSLSTLQSATRNNPAIPLLLGQGFSPPIPGVLAPIPGIPGVGEALKLAIADGRTTEEGGFKPSFASAEDWSLRAAKEQVLSSGRRPSSSSSGETTAVPRSPSSANTATPTRPTLTPSHSFNAREITALAAQMKQWALAEQEKQVEQHVVEAKSAAVLLAAQAQVAAAGEGGEGVAVGTGDGIEGAGGIGDAQLDLSEYAEAYKKQLDALASGYFAQLHRDALARLVEEKTAEDAGVGTAGSAGAGEATTTANGSITLSTSSSPGDSSTTTSAPPHVSPTGFVAAASGHPSPAGSPPPVPTSASSSVPVLSSSQAPTLTSLTSLTSSRHVAESMHIRASAAAAVAAQVMAAKDLARSAGERLVRLGADTQKVVDGVREVVEAEGQKSRRGSETVGTGMVGMRRGSADVATASSAAGMSRTLSGGSVQSIPEQDKMAVEDVGMVPTPSSGAVGGPSQTPVAAAPPPPLPSASRMPASPLSARDLASLPPAQAPSAASHPGAPSDPASAIATVGSHAQQRQSSLPSHHHPQQQHHHPQNIQQELHQSAAPLTPAQTGSSGGPGDLSNPSVLASVAAPHKRDYLLSYAHAMYAKDPHSDDLLPLLHTLESMHPDHLPTLLLISCVYYTRGELESSLYYNKRLLGFDPTYVEAMSNIGTTLRAMGKWSEAENWWWKAIKLRPTYWDATENLLGVLCNPIPHAPPTIDGHGVAQHPPTQPRYHEAIALCEYVESQIFAPPASAQHPAYPPTSNQFLNPIAALPRPRKLPATVPFNHVHRLQNLLYAKGNLRLQLGDIVGAQDEYEKAIEVALSFPEWAQRIPNLQWPLEGCTTRDLLVATTVIGRILAAYAQGGTDNSLVTRTAVQLGVADERGGIPFERIFRVVKDGGDAYAAKLLELGGGVLPTVLLQPHLLAQLPGMLFTEARGGLPALLDPSLAAADPSSASVVDPARKAIEASAKQTTSTMLLTLAKLLQDSLGPTSTVKVIVGGIPASQSLLLPLYYVALALYPSPSTCNNLGILLSTLTATTLVGGNDPAKPPVLLTGQSLALAYYQTGLKLDPRHPHLYTNLGSLLKDMGKLAEAVEMYKSAVQFNPTFDVALANLANAVKDTGQIQESIPYYRQAVKLNPNFPEAVCGLVNALGGVCDWAGRGGVEEEWLVNEHKQLLHVPTPPGRPRPRQGYMAQISDLVARQLREGLSYGIGSLRASGNFQDWMNLIAHAIFGTTHPSPAAMQPWIARLQFLLSDYDRPTSNINEGGYLIRLIERLMRRIQRRWYLSEFGAKVYIESGEQTPNRINPTQADLVKYRRPALPPSLPPIPVPTVLPFHCFTLPVTARETRLISHRTGLRISHATLNQPWMPPIVYPPPRPPANGKINVGYVSSDLGNHPLSHLMQSVFGYHDLDRYNVFVYATSPSDKSPYRLKIEHESQHFFDVSAESTAQIVERIVKDEIHVLINLSGYTKGARNEVFAARPAPVQMSYMGFASTLSAGWCDYFIVDPIVCPPHLVSGNQWRYWAGHTTSVVDTKALGPTDFEGDLDPESSSEGYVYTEKLIYLPHSYFVTDHKQAWREDESVGLKPGEAPITSTLPPSNEVSWALEENKRLQMRRAMFPNIRDDTIILANWNQLYKIDPFIFRIWLNILKQHPNAILWLLRFPAPGEAHLKDTAVRWAGEEVANRVIFTDVANKNDHIHRGRIADLFLDTTECNAHTTAADILWSGTPILTFPRHSHKMCSRVAASIAVATGFGPQMIVNSAEEYERRALELAASLAYETIPADPSKPPTTLEGREQRRGRGELAELRKKLFLTREQSPLFDTRRWVRNLETGLREAWERWVRGHEFEDAPEWMDGPGRASACIWIEDDVDAQNLQRRRPYF
ncbi:hypothetical protein JCM11251_003916 [Rhodosporidiobolus azoricus]